MFFLKDDVVFPTRSVNYMGNEVYSVEYYGQCAKCGWALDENGNCTNQNCNQYGPPDRD